MDAFQRCSVHGQPVLSRISHTSILVFSLSNWFTATRASLVLISAAHLTVHRISYLIQMIVSMIMRVLFIDLLLISAILISLAVAITRIFCISSSIV